MTLCIDVDVCVYTCMQTRFFFERLCNKTHLYAGCDSLIRVSRLCACACMCTCIGVKFVYSCMYTSIGINLLIRIYPQNRAYLHYIILYITDECLTHAYTDKETHTHTPTHKLTHTRALTTNLALAVHVFTAVQCVAVCRSVLQCVEV